MIKKANFKSTILSVLFWSVISAAFIGPGTVTTASSAGAAFGLDILWALLFSTLACLILQEAAARITIISGYSLGEAIAIKYSKSKKSERIKVLILLSIFIGGIAYQAGNILGAVSGSMLLFGVNPKIITTGICILCAIMLWFGNYKTIANLLGLIVAVMGLAFIRNAFDQGYSLVDIIGKSFNPQIPNDSEWLIIGLIGTTIVPYNLFLASGISKGQSINSMRFGISIAILIGGIISMAILVTGTMVKGPFSFENLSLAMNQKNGAWANALLGLGLFAAGFTSSITAPLATAVTAKSMFGWSEKENKYRATWLIILISGFLFGISGIEPIPVIVLAQVINGLLLPIACIFLVIIINDPLLIPREKLNHTISNILIILVVGVTTLLGSINISKVIAGQLNFENNEETILWSIVIATILTIALSIKIYFLRKRK